MEKNESGGDLFLMECEQLLAQVEELTLDLDHGQQDAEELNQLFRIFHTIKGSGAMAGFDDVAAFTHGVETVLDDVRSGRLAWSAEIVELVLASKDHIEALVVAAAEGAPAPQRAQAELVARLAALAPGAAAPAPCAVREKPLHRYQARLCPQAGAWITDDALLALSADLARLGDLTVTIDDAGVPPLDELDPARCSLIWSLELISDETLEEVRDRFIFVESDAELTLEDELFFGAPDGAFVLFDALPDAPLTPPTAAPAEEVAAPAAAEPGPAPAPVAPRVPVAPVAPRASRASGGADAMVRVSAEKLDRLVDLVGELVIGRSRLAQVSSRLRDAELGGTVEELERLVVELRESVLGIRMMALGSTFSRFKRLVHDLSGQLGKQIDLVTAGAETEIDKSVLDQLVDPLLHLIRNAVDHGIEPGEERRALGKPERGTIRLSARHEGQHVVITIEDDGKGLDADAIRAKAIQRGLISPEQRLPRAELYKLIFLPGFSTAREVTGVSGRGVGMDVVKRGLDALRGTVTIASEPGHGATLSLRLPLTLAIIDGLLVEVAGTRYIMPLAAVTETVELPPEDRRRHNGRRAVVVRGELVPYVSLRDAFGATGAEPAAEKVVIFQREGGRVGLVVDRVLGEHQTVIQPLGRMYQSVDVVSGATILGDGRVALILDVAGIVRADAERSEPLRPAARRGAIAGLAQGLP